MSNLANESEIVQAIFKQDNSELRQIICNKGKVNHVDSERRTPLHAAAYVGNVEIMETLILEGAEVNSKDSRWLTPLHRACARGNHEAVQLLLNNQADVNVRDKMWQSPLHVSAANNAVQCADQLLPRLNNLNFSDRGGHSPLHHAALNGHQEMVKLLLKRGATIGAYDRQERRALHWAAYCGETKIIHTLVAHGSDILWKDKVEGDTPAHAAAASGQLQAMGALLELGFAVDIENSKGNTCLHVACLNGHDEIVQLLLDAGAQVDKTNKYKCSPLHYAAISLHGTRCLELLMEKRANPNMQDEQGRTPLHLTAMLGRYSRLDTLLKYHSRVDIVDNSGNSALHLAARHGQEMLVSALLQAGADPFLKGANSRLPIHMAALHSNVNSCRKLLGANSSISPLDIVSMQDDQLRSCLHHAACSGSIDCIEIFLQYLDKPDLLVEVDCEGRMPLHYAMGAAIGECAKRMLTVTLQQEGSHHYVNVKDKEGRTPLHHASATDENGTCVELLLERGANVCINDNLGVSPLHYAAAQGHDAVAKLLIDFDTSILKSTHQAGESEVATPLHYAAYYGHVNVVNALAAEMVEFDDVSLDVADWRGRSPLELAAMQSNTKCGRMLISFGASPSHKNIYDDSTPLHAAARSGYDTMMEVVIDGMRATTTNDEHVCKLINAKDDHKCTPLMYAITNGHHHCVEYLLSQKASLWPVDKFGCTALHRAAVSGFEPILTSLLAHAEQEHGNDVSAIVSARTYNGRTALHFAAIRGNSCILEELVERAQAVNVIDRFGYTPLHYACLEGHEPCVEVLLNHDSFCEFNGSTFSPLHCAVYGDNEACADRLLEIMGSDIVNLRDRKGRTPLHVCSIGDALDCTRFLLRHGAEIDAADYKLRSPLLVAAYKQSGLALEELLKSGADPSVADHRKNTALHAVCIREDVKAAMQVFEHMDLQHIDSQNDIGQTALHIAARKGLTEVVLKLLESGCSIEVEDNEGLTPALACAPTQDVADCLHLLIGMLISSSKQIPSQRRSSSINNTTTRSTTDHNSSNNNNNVNDSDSETF